MALLTKSIRWRFVLWLAFLLVGVLSGFGITAYQLHLLNRFAQLDDELKTRVAALSGALRTPPMMGDRGGPPPMNEKFPGPPPGDGFRGHGPPSDEKFPGRFGPGERRWPFRVEFQISSEAARLFAETTTNSFYYAVWSRDDGGMLARATNAPAKVPQPEPPGKDTGTFFRNRGAFREACHYTERADCILVGRSIETEIATTRRFVFWLVAGGLSVLAIGLGGVWLLAGRALAPVNAISAAATRISAGNLAERINSADTDNELGQLAQTLNSTFARLEAAFAQQKQFTADASHELRTPLAVLISEAQTTLARDRSPADYRESMSACLDTAQKMRRLTDSLLELARLDAGQEILHREKADLAAIAQDCVALVNPLTTARQLQVVCELAPAETFCDAARMTQVITNLLANAINYNRDGGSITVATRREDQGVVLSVADTGRGISAADQPRVFERFFCADKSHSGDGNGLGLSICRAIVTAHGGTIAVASEENVGTTFTVRLPGGAGAN